MDPIWLHVAFRTLVGLFDKLGLKTNVGKKVEMVSRSCQATGT